MTHLERAQRLIGDAPMYVREGLSEAELSDFAEQIRACIDAAVKEDVAAAMPLYQFEYFDEQGDVRLFVRYRDWKQFLEGQRKNIPHIGDSHMYHWPTEGEGEERGRR